MTLFRFHRGSLEESMKTCVEVSTIESLLRVIEIEFECIIPLNAATLESKLYCYDSRIKWDTYLVSIGGMPVGFSNGPLK